MNESKRDKKAIKKGKNKYHVKRLNNEAEWGKECEIDKRIENDDTDKIERKRKEDEYDILCQDCGQFEYAVFSMI